ncbi:MAG TPA: 50S ribosomal protein L3 [bacterium]|nr:50S ribosomal protein L3 [bacterium]
MRQILGIKRGMTTLFLDNGDTVGVTVIEAGPCPVVQVKTRDKDGYEAVQVGIGTIRKNLVNKPRAGQFGALAPTRYLRELRLANAAELKVGDLVTVDQFKAGERVDIVGISRGLGFQGAVRRHKFGGGPVTHGQSDRTRAPGSVGASSYPSRTFRGQRMAGRMGNVRVTETNLQVAAVRPEENLIFVRGAVPGKKNSLVMIRQSRKQRSS